MALSHHLALDISDNALRIAEVRLSDRYPIVLRTDVVESAHLFGSPLLHRVPYEYALAKAFVSDVASMLQGRALLSQRISIVLPSSVALLATLPVDARLSDEEREEHFQWECRQLSGAGADEAFHVYRHCIGRTRDADYYLIAALPRETVHFLKSTMEHLTFTVTSIEIDHFLFETFIPRLFPDAAEQTIGVLGITPPHCVASVSGADGYVGLTKRARAREGAPVHDALAALHAVLTQRPDVTVQRVYLYGAGATNADAATLGGALEIPVRCIHASKAVSFVTQAEAESAAAHPPHTFDAVFCAAIKGAA